MSTPAVSPLARRFALLTRLLVGAVLIYAGASKAIAPSAEFVAALAAYKLLPTAASMLIAKVWPWLELLTGVYLVFGFYTRIFAAVAAAQFAVFTVILAVTLARGIDPGSCGCFGVGITLPVHQTLMLDCVLLACAIWTFLKSRLPLPFSVDSWTAS